ncbi:MAG: hypothetical protein HDQ96_03190 [Lachnospiraceae bacterium]|nr:hypothetical protein [Lachnospiraceae bacterium]
MAVDALAAFANTKGGHIILGVKEGKKKTLPRKDSIIPEKNRSLNSVLKMCFHVWEYRCQSLLICI